MTQYTLAHIVGMISEDLFNIWWEKRLPRVSEKREFLYVNTDFSWVVVDYLNEQKYHVS